MKEFARIALILVAVAGGTLAAKLYNRVAVPHLAAEVQEQEDFTGTPLTKIPLHAYSTRVLVKFGEGNTDVGTGNLIRSDLVITNWHNLRNNKSGVVDIELADGTIVKANVLKKDQERDLALLELTKPTILPQLCLAEKEPAKGEHLSVSGWAKGKEYSEATGNVVGRRSPTKAGKNTLFLMDCCVKPGMSGSAALNDAGQLAGVIFGCSDGYTYGAGVDTIREFLQDTKYWKN